LNFGEHVLVRRELSIKHKQFLLLLRHRLSSQREASSANPSIGHSNGHLCSDLSDAPSCQPSSSVLGASCSYQRVKRNRQSANSLAITGGRDRRRGLSHQTKVAVAFCSFRFLNSVMSTPDEIQEKTFCKWCVFDYSEYYCWILNS
jgi:hypothetical protein